MNKGTIEIYQLPDNQTEVEVRFEEDTVWLTQVQIVTLFKSGKSNISEHITHIFESDELDPKTTVRNFRTVQIEGPRRVERNRIHYNLDVVISVGYRVNTKQGIRFRQWATQRLKTYMVQGYAINEKRLAQTKQKIKVLKSGTQIISRTMKESADNEEFAWLKQYVKGLVLLDDYDHKRLDSKGLSKREAILPGLQEYRQLIEEMKVTFDSDIFGREKDHGFQSSVSQIGSSFDGQDLYPSLEEKAATLLYLIVKNHSFVDGNKRIGAASFLLFLERNNMLRRADGTTAITSEALVSLTLFVAASKSQEMKTVKHLIISFLNRDVATA
jgi:prophage maintenance system killer protein